MGTRARLISFRIIVCLFSAAFLPVVSNADEIPPSEYWKNQIVFPDDPFRAYGTFEYDPGWVKFTILLDPYDANIVYFQDSRAYAFHYHFAAELLTPFLGMTPQEFDEVTLYEEGQEAILGAVIMPPNTGWPAPPAYPEYGIQFVRHDLYTKEEIASLFNIVKSRVVAEPGVEVFYFPSYEQIGVAEAHREWFESQGIPISSAARWSPGNVCYSTGWALGELKYVQGNNIAYAYSAGILEPNDILLTDGVPAEVPHVAGIISLSASTPNSHVAILARTYGVPFVYLALAGDVDRAWELLGHRVVLRAFEKWPDYDIRLIDVEGVLDEETIEEILALKAPPELEISAIACDCEFSASTDGLLPCDVNCFGGKAANYGMLRTSIDGNSPVAVAFSFNLWNEFLDQTIFGGDTLRDQINARLSGYSYPPADMAALSSDLLYTRSLFTNTYVTTFTQAQEDGVIAVLQDANYGFDAYRKIRFRSSTNVEDAEHFTGAGLYDSFSGCLADDLDGNSSGPCLCDEEENNERGVFRAIRKVFASFYNDNAFLERLRHDINEADVGMALLVHHSFPDEIELANGVATLERRYSYSCDITLVTQLGAVSVANPQDGSIPEEVSAYCSTHGTYLTLIRGSNLVPLGATVLDWTGEYEELAQLLLAAAEQFEAVTGKTSYTLDFEYKKVAPGGAAIPEGGLVVKQIRELPQPDNTASIPAFLVNKPVEYCTFQGEYSSVFANHRLKSRWLFATDSLWLNSRSLTESFFGDLRVEYVDRGRVRRVSGVPGLWPFASHRLEDAGSEGNFNTIDGWLMHHLSNPRSCELVTSWIPTLVRPTESPILTLEDFYYGRLEWQVEYERAVPSWDWDGPMSTTSESVTLCLCPQAQQGDLLQERFFGGPNDLWLGPGDVNITTRFYWPPPPTGIIVGYTAPLVRWVETVIEGLTSEPIVLHNWYSQTYRPDHHNFGERFIFEPRLEPGLSAEILAELRAKDIRFIHICPNPDPPPPYGRHLIEAYGLDEKSFLSGDIDQDKNVDFADVKLLAGRWLDSVCDTCGRADLTGDGRVRFDDFQELARDWLMTIE